MFDFLPEALVHEIVHRVPLKSIGKCMLVCKSWNAMINSHSFISSHLQHSLINPTTSLLLFRYVFPSYKEQYLIYSSSFRRIAEFSFSVTVKKLFYFVGAVNGVVCLYDYYTHDIVLLNPLIGKELQLPKSISTCVATLFGFGFDSKKNDFKVVRVCCVDSGESVVAPMVELYSLEEGNWRIIDASYLELLDLRIGDCREQLFFHENVHWVAYDSLQCNCILTFNMVEEKFEKMELPEEVATSPCKLVTSVIEGCLSIIEYLSSSICTIWSRRESWMKTYSVSSEVEFVQLMGLSTSEILIVRRHLYINLYSFDLHSEVMKNVGTLSVGKDLCAADFTQSLVLLDRGSNAASLLSGHDDEWEVQDFEEPLPFDKLNSIRWN